MLLLLLLLGSGMMVIVPPWCSRSRSTTLRLHSHLCGVRPLETSAERPRVDVRRVMNSCIVVVRRFGRVANIMFLVMLICRSGE